MRTFFCVSFTILIGFLFYSNLRCQVDSYYLRTDNPDTLTLLSDKVLSFKNHGIVSRTKKKLDRAESLRLTTPSGIKVPVSFFDRKSNKVIIFGQGFPAGRESGAVLARLFPDYDVVLFDYRWSRMLAFVLQPSTVLHPLEKFLLEDDEEVITVVNYIKSRKYYDEVIGFTECYSAFTFAKAQVKMQQKDLSLFTKLIFDSCWYSLWNFARQIMIDPMLPIKPQDGGTPEELKKFFRGESVNSCLDFLMRLVTPNICIEPYLSSINKVPILFIHGTRDLLVPLSSTFEKIWKSVCNTRKVAFITPFQHSNNLENPFVYQKICDLFITSQNVDEFSQRLST